MSEPKNAVILQRPLDHQGLCLSARAGVSISTCGRERSWRSSARTARANRPSCASGRRGAPGFRHHCFSGEARRSIGNVRQAQSLGVAMIFQELNLVPSRTVAQNIYLGREPVGRTRASFGMGAEVAWQQRNGS